MLDFPTASRSNYDIKAYSPENVISDNDDENGENNAFLSLIDKIIKLDRSLSQEEKIFISAGFKAFIVSHFNPMLFFIDFFGNESIKSIIDNREKTEGFELIDLFNEMAEIIEHKFILLEDEENSDVFDLKVEANRMFSKYLDENISQYQQDSS